ncbi:uncharacterized protein LOC128388295 [Panonychus citri]|uniref:uncharacterized protein LOC128388295 n=1 Tax=Panonychus citri TaxID=50023 RepID=UPI002307558F|nr:uncharacterized protein LOC128388295 [Panonychus citri]
MFDCCDKMSDKINGLCEQLENLKLNLSDCDNPGPRGSNKTNISPLDNNKTIGDHFCEFTINEMIKNFSQFTNDVKEIKTTQTAIMLIVSQLLNRMTKLESHFVEEQKVEVKKVPKRRQSKQHQEQPQPQPQEQQQSEEKENIQETKIKTEKVALRRKSGRGPLSNVSIINNTTLSPCIEEKDTSCTILYDRNASISTSMTLRPLNRRTDYRSFC